MAEDEASSPMSAPAANGRSRSTRTRPSLIFVQELLDRGLRLVRRHRERKPVARVVDRLVPGEVAPEVQVLPRVAGRLRELAQEALDDAIRLRVELVPRDDTVHEPPLHRLLRRNRLAQQDDLARA